MKTSKELICPFCGGKVTIRVCDGEGNLRPDSYEEDPWSGLGFVLYHDLATAKDTCPIAHHVDEQLGTIIFESRELAEKSWRNRKLH